ncbi:MAG: flagellar biosynthesis protein FlhF [Suilimivivens sp.]
MIIKKFQGKSEEEAVEAAKRELGSNVVIMNVRNVKRTGIFGFLKPQLTEVTVALEEESEQRILNPVRREESKEVKEAKEVRTQPLVDAIASGEILKTENSAIEEKLDNLHVLLEQQLQKPEEVKEKEEPVQEKEEGEMERFMKLLYNTMLENEVNEKYANQIIDEIEKLNKPGMPFDYALANVYQKMILKFGKPSEITLAQKGPKIVFFVGPTGVGKTTTIAKIASKFSVDGGKKVALLTADTYRIAAAEQLRTYANILEVPFRVIYTTEEVEQALKDFKEYDFILVDTAGHSHHNEAQKETMKGFVHSVDGLAEKEVFLVLSATTKYSDLISIADAYSAMTDYKLIFTKLDETNTLGNLLNIKLHTGADLSYVTCGQNVPDDIENFNPQRTVKQLLGGRKN